MHTVEAEKHPVAAFALALLPGMGHLYLGKYVRTLLYAGGASVPAAIFILFTIMEGRIVGEAFLLTAFAVFIVWAVNLLDMAITLSMRRPNVLRQRQDALSAGAMQGDWASAAPMEQPWSAPTNASPARPPAHLRTTAALLSLIPGAGHLHLGRTRRGLLLLFAALAALIGTPVAAILLGSKALLLGWLALPALVAYAAFDAVDSANAALRGDRTHGDEDEWTGGKTADGRYPELAVFLSLIPGVGHMYLGFVVPGVRLLAIAMMLLYVGSEYRIDLALYALPVLWCWSFFDAQRLASAAQGYGAADSHEAFSGLAHRWAGYAIIAVGCYIAFDRIALAALTSWFPALGWLYALRSWSEPAAASLLFIGVGLDLLRSRKRE